MSEYVDYDYDSGSVGGKFLNLKAKGDKVTIRLADKPIHYFVHWVDNKPIICDDPKTCNTCVVLEGFTPEEMKKKENAQLKRRSTFIWPVIDRADGEAKIFKGGISIFLAIGEFAKDPKWGGEEKDGTKFDITITRTETSLQNFYSVVPDPTSLGKEITPEEKKAVEGLTMLINSIVTAKIEDPGEVTDEDLEGKKKEE